MYLQIENRGRRAAVIQLDATVEKVRQTVRTTKRDRKTGKKTIVSRERVIGGSLTILAGEMADKLPSGKPIPARVARLEQVRRDPALVVSSVDPADWDEKHRSKPAAPKAKRKASGEKKSEGAEG